MNKECGNIMKISRKRAGFTQETAAEALFCSVESISSWERGEVSPPQEMIVAMVGLYKDEFLGVIYLQNTPLGGRYLKSIQQKELAPAILNVQKEYADINGKLSELVKIGCDGVISSTERPAFDSIVVEIEEFIMAAFTLICCVGRHIDVDPTA